MYRACNAQCMNQEHDSHIKERRITTSYHRAGLSYVALAK
jgi:hypothetical protein